jgi:hypothetical protein
MLCGRVCSLESAGVSATLYEYVFRSRGLQAKQRERQEAGAIGVVHEAWT